LTTNEATEDNIGRSRTDSGSSSSSSKTSSYPQQQEEFELSQLLSSKDWTRTDRQGQNTESLSHRLRSVSQAYHHQHNTLSKSHRHHMDNSIVDESVGNSLPYHTIVIDCSPIAFVDQMGAKALYQVCVCVHKHARILQYLCVSFVSFYS